MSEVEKIPFQMSEVEVYERLARSECPVQISIDKYKMYRKWVEYKLKEKDYECIKYSSHTSGATCALCIVNNDICEQCVLTKIKSECCPDKAVISPWYRVKYACLYIDETEERQQELFDAIDCMIEVLEKCKEVEE